jgi:hypothetical protein
MLLQAGYPAWAKVGGADPLNAHPAEITTA